MKKSTIFVGLVASFAFAGAAQASTVITTACKGVADSAGCLFRGNVNGNSNEKKNSYLAAQDAYNKLFSANITLQFITSTDNADFSNFGSVTGLPGSSGTWSLAGYDVQHVAVKAGNGFVLYDADVLGSTWSTIGLSDDNKLKNVSHIAFFGTQAAPPAVPEPATWAMFLMGFGAVGYSLRSRRTNYRFAQAV
jgi:hypothetical protein